MTSSFHKKKLVKKQKEGKKSTQKKAQKKKMEEAGMAQKMKMEEAPSEGAGGNGVFLDNLWQVCALGISL